MFSDKCISNRNIGESELSKLLLFSYGIQIDFYLHEKLISLHKYEYMVFWPERKEWIQVAIYNLTRNIWLTTE